MANPVVQRLIEKATACSQHCRCSCCRSSSFGCLADGQLAFPSHFFLRVARKNPFLRELAQTTVRWVTLLIGVLIALEIMDATALVGAVLGTAGVLGWPWAFVQDILGKLSGRHPHEHAPDVRAKDHVVIDATRAS